MKLAKYARDFFFQDISRATNIACMSNRDIAGFQLYGSTDGTMLDALPAR
jgi:hypothetical protein